MAAGDGASEQRRAAAERVSRLKRRLQQAERDEQAWAAGAAGEALVEEKLKALEALGWLVLHDVHWPGRPRANLDHVLVGPGGVLVVDAKNWTGQIEVRGGVLYQGGRSREKETSGALEQSAALTVLLEPRHRRTVQAWLCMVGQPEMRARSASGVRIQGLNTLTDAVAALPHVLDPVTVRAIHVYLTQLLTGPLSPELITSAHVGKAWARGNQPRTAGPAAFEHPVSSRQHRPTFHGTPSRGRGTRPYYQSAGRSSKPRTSCLGAIGLLILMLAVSGMLTNLATHITYGLTHASPHPAPAITTTVPHQ